VRAEQTFSIHSKIKSIQKKLKLKSDVKTTGFGRRYMQVMFSYSELLQKSPDDVHIDSIPRRFGPSSISSEWPFSCIRNT